MEDVYHLAMTMADKNSDRNKHWYDGQICSQVLVPGGRIGGVAGKHPVTTLLCLVADKLGVLPVYKIIPEIAPGQTKTVQRNFLLPMGELVSVPCKPNLHSGPEQQTGAGALGPPGANQPLPYAIIRDMTLKRRAYYSVS